jgi:hypothetical protein
MQLTSEQNKLLNKIEDITIKNHESLDKTILTLSSVFIGVIIGFSKDINFIASNLITKLLMLIVIFLFVFAILFTLIAYKISTYEGKYAQENIIHAQSIHNIVKITKVANSMEHLAFGSFSVGLFSVFIFFLVLFFPCLV